jgi:hypothetical protein
MGKGGGGAPAPTSTTAYQTNLPEYAKPYVMNMLGAAQNQLFTTTPGADGGPGEITGFKPYTPYSTDPTDYFAGPSSLQRQVYGEAGQMQTPGQFAPATGLAGAAGMGQLGTAQQAGMFGGLGTALGAAGAMQAMPAFGAGQQFMRGITDPSTMASYMSPYQQGVTDIAKNAAVREAQIAGQQANLGAARQGTYGGARQALQQSERERNLLANLSNIQAQGSQSAYDRALAQQQFGANLGLQGIQTGLQGVQTGLQGIGQGLQGVGAQQAGYAGAGQAASTLGQLGGAQQQADLARMGFQQQTGQQQQAYQQNIINQAIQDYATAQQYPYMQLSTMSNLLRGLPMQSMSTQQYQAQPSTTQQLLGLAGTGASLYGAMGRKEGGTIKEYARGGIAEDLRAKLEDMADTDPRGLAKLVSQSSSKEVKKIGNEILSGGIATANTGGLATNMAGGGIIAFNGEEGSQVQEMTDEEREDYIKNNAYLQRSRSLANLPGATGEFLRKYNPVTGSAYSEALQRFVNESPADQAARFRKASSRSEQAANPTQEVPAVKTATQRKEDNDRDAALASVGQSTKVDYKKAEEILRAAKDSKGGDKGSDKGSAGNEGIAGIPAGRGAVGLDAIIAENRRLAGLEEGPGAKSAAFMKMLEDREAGKAGARESDRYLRAAKAFAKFGSTAGPFGKVASEALGDFTEGEIAARKEQDKLDIEGARLQAEVEKIQRLEAMGYVKEARAAADKLADRQRDYDIARMQRDKPGEFDKMMAAFKENPAEFEKFRKSLTSSDDASRLNAIYRADTVLSNNTAYMNLVNSKKPEDKQKAAQMRKDLIDEYMGAMGTTQTASAGGGNRLRFDASGKQI